MATQPAHVHEQDIAPHEWPQRFGKHPCGEKDPRDRARRRDGRGHKRDGETHRREHTGL